LAFTLYIWKDQLEKEKQTCRNEYPNKKDYDDRISALNSKLEEIDRFLESPKDKKKVTNPR